MGKEDNKTKDGVDLDEDEVVELCRISTVVTLTEMSREGEYSVKKILKDLSKAPPSKQVAVGAGTGWLAGYLTMKAGRSMATAIGGSILLLQLAHYHGYIQVDWNRMTSDTSSLADRIRQRLRIRSKSGLERILDFAKNNIYVTASFTSGFFLGIAHS